MKDHHYYVYILTNDFNTLTYTGVTNDLKRRVWEHKGKIADSHTKKYHISKLVYYEVCEYVISAIEREKQIKAGSRAKKNKLIESMNPEWKDLYGEI
jgi:putative endonuclease